MAAELAAVAAAGFARLEALSRHAAASLQDRAIARAAHALNASLDLGEVLDTLAREAAAALAADAAGVYLGDAEQGAVAAAGHGTGDDWGGHRVRPGEGAAGQVLVTGRPFATEDFRHEVSPPATVALQRLESALAVPMSWDGALRGVLAVGWNERRRIRDEDRWTLEAMAGLATVACRNAEAYESVQRAARTDALTGLLNHGAMQVRVREEIARSERDGSPLACLILDLDDFKHVNDSRGHQAGDELLRRVAAILQQDLRPYDQVARYGGDEFVLLLPGSDEGEAARVAGRIRDAALAETGGCSVGVAAWEPGLGPRELIEKADRALLLAKRTGKGRVAVANPRLEGELALEQIEQGSPAAVQALAAAIEERDAYTSEDSSQVVRLARGVAMLLGLGAEQVRRIASAALLHDVGKLAVPQDLLRKAGPLTQEEWAVMAEHPVVGERILVRSPELAPLAPIVRHEHEHWDGSGYPDGLKGTAIPVGSRVILACEAYVAMTVSRPYRAALEPAAAVEELRAGAGRQFDPEIVEALLDLLGDGRPEVPDRARNAALRPGPARPVTRRETTRRSAPGG